MKLRASRLVAMVLTGIAAGIPAVATEPEDELKAAIVLSFLRYSEWPTGGDSALRVGVLGRPALVQTLRRVLEGKSVETRPVRVVELKPGGECGGCQVVYLATGKPAEIKHGLESADAARALTIGESERFLEFGGAVNLLVVDGRMSFEVSLEAVSHTGITISSKLLRFGRVLDAGRSRPPA